MGASESNLEHVDSQSETIFGEQADSIIDKSELKPNQVLYFKQTHEDSCLRPLDVDSEAPDLADQTVITREEAKDDNNHFETATTCGDFVSISPVKDAKHARLSRDNPRDCFFRNLLINNVSRELKCESVAETFFQQIDECKEEVETVRKRKPAMIRSMITK